MLNYTVPGNLIPCYQEPRHLWLGFQAKLKPYDHIQTFIPLNGHGLVPDHAFAYYANVHEELRTMHLSLLTDRRPLIVVGKGAAQSHADSIIRHFVDKVQIPVLSTSMGRGVLPDNHPLSVIAARSLALAKADAVLILGARYPKLRL